MSGMFSQALSGTGENGAGLDYARLLLLQARLEPKLTEKNSAAIRDILQEHQEFWAAKELERELAQFNSESMR